MSDVSLPRLVVSNTRFKTVLLLALGLLITLVLNPVQAQLFGSQQGPVEGTIQDNHTASGSGGSDTFTALGAGLTGVWRSFSDWGDYDNDGDLDLVVTGRDSNDNVTATIYRNGSDGGDSMPTPPTGLTASGGDKQVSLSWDANNESNPAGYHVYRSTSSFSDVSNATKLNGSLISETSYTDTEVTNGTGYFYRVTAVDSEGNESDPSNEASMELESSSVSLTPADAGLTGVEESCSSIADVDNDGNKDLLVAGEDETDQESATLYLGTGDGTFSEAGAGLTGVDDCSSSIADVDNDGNQDLLITGQDPSGNDTATLYLGSGDGSFTEAGANLAGVDQSSTSIADVDNDGNEDLLITGSDVNGDGSATLYLGNGNGDFTEADADLAGVEQSSTSIADVDNDGNEDLLITGQGPNGPEIAALYLGSGDGSFTEAEANLIGTDEGSVSIADVDKDENQDLLITGEDVNDNESATLYLGNGDGTFSKARAGLTGVSDASTSIADVNSDGNQDLLITGGDANGAEIATLYLGSGDGSFTIADAGLTGTERGSASIADVNVDGGKDLLITGVDAGGNQTATLYLNEESSVLAPPENLSATSGDGKVSLSWNPGGDSTPAGYNVYRSTSSFGDISDATKLNSSLLSSESFTDTNVSDGTTYYYRVTAVGSDGTESNPSNQASAALQDLELIGFEVNQSIQDWENSVPLVEGKKTIVRTFLRTGEETSTPVNVELEGRRNGSSLPNSPLGPKNENFEAEPFPSEGGASTEKLRAELNKSLNFELPFSWRQGTVTLKLVGDGISCADAPAVDGNCEIEVDFQPTATPKITFLEIYWEDDEGEIHEPNIDLDSEIYRLVEMYPVEDVNTGVNEIEMDVNAPPESDDVIDRVHDEWEKDFEGGAISKNHIYVGLVEEFENDNINGETPAPIPSKVAAAKPDQVNSVDDPILHSVAHEIAHALGLGHAIGENGSGYCGAANKTNPPTFPYNKPEIIEETVLGETDRFEGFAALGPTNEGRNEEMWGLNVRKKRVKGTSTSLSTGQRPKGPNGDLMSYCVTERAYIKDYVGLRWVSDTTYTALQESINDRFSTTEPAQLASIEERAHSRSGAVISPKNGQEEEYLMVKGEIDMTAQSASFRPFTSITVSSNRIGVLMPETGDYTLQMLDQGGGVVKEISFEPRVGLSRNVSNSGSFSIPVPADPTIETAQVLFEGNGNSTQRKKTNEVIGSTTASQNPPTVHIEFPNGGEDLSGEEVVLDWSGSDPDGDSLSYTVKYSRNGGSTWNALATSWPRDSLTVDASALGGTSSGLIRVQASDGFNTAQDESDGAFGTSNVPPRASIFSPSDGAVTGQSGLITLDGDGSDAEDGSLSGPALTWRTASGDSLGAGETIEVPAANFSLGTHTIELVATDSVGAADTASVSIQVALSSDPSLVASASALVESDSLVDFGATGTNIAFDSTTGAATVTTELYDSAPIGADGIPQSNVSKYRILIAAGNGLSVGPGTEVRFEADTLGGIGDPTKVQIYRRPAPGNGPFEALDTQVDSMGTPDDPSDDVIFATVSGFGEFVLASDSEPLPVELSGFEATLDGENAVRLIWTTASETGNAGFRVQRKTGKAEEGSWTTVGSVEGAGTTTESKSYRYVDSGLPYEADRLTYRLKQVDTDGTASYSKEVTVEREVKEAELLGTYPNPAQTRATIRYAVPERQDVTIHLYDILGRRVQTVVDGKREGRHERQLDVSRLASGVYFLRLQAEGATKTQKLTVVR